jgi:hypothetical protein
VITRKPRGFGGAFFAQRRGDHFPVDDFCRH